MIDPLVRRARPEDLPAIVRLFVIPDVGNVKNERPETPLPAAYADALAAIDADPNNMFMVAELEGRIVGVFQLTIIQQLTNQGARVAQIESVVVDTDVRGRGVGEAMMRWAIDEARRRRCFRVQLTSNKVRKRAHAFYARLGFTPTHEGFKLAIERTGRHGDTET